jgi:hypothetical protein
MQLPPYSKKGMLPVLFQSDYDLYPTAIWDWKTTNKSFLKLVDLYENEMGIKNSRFILTLLQPELQGVDPYAEDLTKHQKWMIAMECKFNPWYVFREVIRIPATSGSVPIRFKANRGNIALFWSFFNHVDFALLQPRQTGKSVSTDCLNTGIMFIWGEKTTINLITKDSKLREANIERLKDMRDLLPPYIFETTRNDADTKDLLTAVIHGNKYKTAVGRSDKRAADKLGRGLTVPIMHFDELAYIENIEASLGVALASGSAARGQAAEQGQPYGNVYTTTAGDITTRDGGYAHEFMTSGAVWTESWFDLRDNAQLVKVVDKEKVGKKRLIYGAFNHRQLGKTDAWLYKELADSNQRGELADRDFFNIWTLGGEGSPLNFEDKKLLRGSLREPAFTEITPDGYTVRWYIPRHQVEARMQSGRFVMGIDPSELLGQDNDATGMVMIDVETHEIVASGRYNETLIPMLANFMGSMLIKYPNILFVPERKSTGSSIIDMIVIMLAKVGIDPFKRIFNRIVDESGILKTEFAEIHTPMAHRPPDFYDRFKRHFGFNTSGSGRYSRNALYLEALPSSMIYGARRMHDTTLVNELLGLTIRNGRIDHKRGNHDDMVVSMLLAHWVLIRGENLGYYGINVSVFSKAKTQDHEPTNIERYKTEKMDREKAEFEELMEQLKKEGNQLVAMKLELRLRALSRRVNVEETVGVGIDAMLKQARDERTRRVRTARFGSNSGQPQRFAA